MLSCFNVPRSDCIPILFVSVSVSLDQFPSISESSSLETWGNDSSYNSLDSASNVISCSPPRGRFSHLAMFRIGSLLFIPAYLTVTLYRPLASAEEDGNTLLMTGEFSSHILRGPSH